MLCPLDWKSETWDSDMNIVFLYTSDSLWNLSLEKCVTLEE